jgi:hypothetical protein
MDGIPPEDRVQSQLGGVATMRQSQSDSPISSPSGEAEEEDDESEDQDEVDDEDEEFGESTSFVSAPNGIAGDNGTEPSRISDQSTVQSGSTETHVDSDEDGGELDLEKTISRRASREARGGIHVVLAETGYHGKRLGKRLLNWAITVPTDVTLSLSKGFHNAPKLYHDRTVAKTPTVMGVRSGFRAAGKVDTTSLFSSVTRLVETNSENRNSPRNSTKASPDSSYSPQKAWRDPAQSGL